MSGSSTFHYSSTIFFYSYYLFSLQNTLPTTFAMMYFLFFFCGNTVYFLNFTDLNIHFDTQNVRTGVSCPCPWLLDHISHSLFPCACSRNYRIFFSVLYTASVLLYRSPCACSRCTQPVGHRCTRACAWTGGPLGLAILGFPLRSPDAIGPN